MYQHYVTRVTRSRRINKFEWPAQSDVKAIFFHSRRAVVLRGGHGLYYPLARRGLRDGAPLLALAESMLFMTSRAQPCSMSERALMRSRPRLCSKEDP